MNRTSVRHPGHAKPWVLFCIAGALVLVVALFVIRFDGAPVALPPGNASPSEVVRGYVDALEAHDFDAAGQLLTPGQRRQVEQTWFEDVDSITDLQVGNTTDENPKWSGHKPGQQVMNVPVRFNLHWRWLHNDTSMDEGPNTWGYQLVRDSGADPWRIFDEGTGLTTPALPDVQQPVR